MDNKSYASYLTTALAEPLLACIMSFLPTRERFSAFVPVHARFKAAARLNSSWNAAPLVVSQSHTLLQLSRCQLTPPALYISGRLKLSQDALDAVSRMSALTSLDVIDASGLVASILENLSQWHPSLRSLRVYCGRTFTAKGREPPVKLTVSILGEVCKLQSLAELDISGALPKPDLISALLDLKNSPSLTSLAVHSLTSDELVLSLGKSGASPLRWLHTGARLTTAGFESLQLFAALTHLHTTGSSREWLRVPALPASLRRFVVDQAAKLRDLSALATCSALEELELSYFSQVEWAPLAGCSRLRRLALSNWNWCNLPALRPIASLRQLELALVQPLRDEHLAHLTVGGSWLTSLTIRGCRELTGACLPHIAKSLPELTALDIQVQDLWQAHVLPLLQPQKTEDKATASETKEGKAAASAGSASSARSQRQQQQRSFTIRPLYPMDIRREELDKAAAPAGIALVIQQIPAMS